MKLSALVSNGNVPFLSVRQPWAWALFHGKDVENRSWTHTYTGPVIIHASATLPQMDFFHEDCDLVEQRTGVTLPDEVSLGAVIGLIEIQKIVTDSTSLWAAPGHFHWCTNPILELFEPVESKGTLKLYWNRDKPTLAEIAKQIRTQGL